MSDLAKFETWLRDRGRAESTAREYRRDIATCQRSNKRIHRKILDESLSPKRRRRLLASLRAWAKFNNDRELLDVLSDIKLPPPRRVTEKSPLSREEWEVVADAIEAHDDIYERAVMLIMLDRGLRVSDVLRMRRDEIEEALDQGALYGVTKGGRRTRIAVDQIRPALEAFLESDRDWEIVAELISWRARDPMIAARERISRALQDIGKAAGIDNLHTHRLRRTYAVFFLKEMQGDPEALVKLQQHMDWADLATAASYVDHARHEELDQVAARIGPRRTRRTR